MIESRQRHGCLTAWLILMIITNSLTAYSYLFSSDAIRKIFPNIQNWIFPAVIVLAICNVVCAIALWKWKKWGFVGFLLSSIIAFAINLMIGLQTIYAILGLLGVAVLYGLLHIGRENKAWELLD